jgi:hypothetical protein
VGTRTEQARHATKKRQALRGGYWRHRHANSVAFRLDSRVAIAKQRVVPIPHYVADSIPFAINDENRHNDIVPYRGGIPVTNDDMDEHRNSITNRDRVAFANSARDRHGNSDSDRDGISFTDDDSDQHCNGIPHSAGIGDRHTVSNAKHHRDSY